MAIERAGPAKVTVQYEGKEVASSRSGLNVMVKVVIGFMIFFVVYGRLILPLVEWMR